MPTSNPVSPKVTAASVAGALTVIVVWLLEAFGVQVPAEVASAFTVALMAVIAYLVRDPARGFPPGTGRRRAVED